MEYHVTKPNIRIMGVDFSTPRVGLFRRDGISNYTTRFNWDQLDSNSVPFRDLYTSPSPSFIDLTASDFMGGGLTSGQGEFGEGRGRFSVYFLTGSVKEYLSFPKLFQFQIGSEGPLFSIPTFSGLNLGSEWSERECWDMFGIVFDGNRDLRRLLTDYGFSGFPLRKDFPVVGFVETHYDEEMLQLRLEKISLAQEIRPFLFQSGATIV